MLTKVYLFCDSVERYLFFKRFYSVDRDISIVFVTNQPLVCFLCKTNKSEFIYLNICIGRSVPINLDVSSYYKTFEYLLGKVTRQESERILKIYIKILNDKIRPSKENKKVFLIWNGHSSLAHGAKFYANNNNIDCFYLELSNLPNKIFVSKHGVNAYSELYSQPSILDEYDDIDNIVHESWLLEYEEYKTRIIPQAKVSKFDLMLRSINKLFNLMFFLIVFKKRVDFGYFWARPTPVNVKGVDSVDIDINRKYIFCPLQVSSDTQILLNSDVDNEGLLRTASLIAKEQGKELFVKIHPAEKSQVEVNRIVKLRDELGFYLVSIDTITLIKQSDEVFVINSTVGLESMIYGKKVTTLGRAFFSGFNEERLKKYIHRYLINGVEYFDTEKINMDKILGRFL
ncbi:hypothetical protein F0248_21685 [Vibrio crassostreae]|uniref:capsular polysaccharide export protein, LipB/KpsS family n=1 Tax=Vibrio crassostreae TaxID=246167 RepID=UPI000F4A7460|nr:hypothetical protein [Vibrio crassostreae]NOH77550.1 hypothetical protein [Vibrio crassostreae]NOI55645.1 hypothetical protein [Vibrio crassostreae]ROR09685.1 capsular polysaccharide export protein [Vibrio crassostreae]CAK1794581.1 capsular polysaccharide export protein [Vibrio crassostreae]CAK2279260.1 capsular polysaccharide export protein [Vibrio crassostreae]